MSDKTRAFFLSLTIAALLIYSAVGTTSVYADDGTTTGSTDTTTTVTNTDTTSTTGDVQPEVAAPPLLEQLPDNTTVTVVDAAGEAQPLVSQASADAILLSDPIWCPVGQSPTPGANGCTTSFTSFDGLLSELANNATYQGAGTIYVQKDAYAGGESSINFNSYNLSNISGSDLTVQGGWDPTTGDLTGTSSFKVPFIVGTSANPWGGSLTFNNIVIDGANQTGLTLYSQKDISVSNVDVTNSLNGADLNAGGNVTVTNSKFHKNKQKGANIVSGGNVKVTNSQFNDNGTGNINDPAGSGLDVNSSGMVTLTSIEANNNQLFGANINSAGVVTISQGFFNGNQGIVWTTGGTSEGYGLQVVSTSDISLYDVSASNNYLFGASLTGVNVTIGKNIQPDTTFNTFNNNGVDWDIEGKGLVVSSTGVVSLANIEANNNQNFGTSIDATGSVGINNSFFNGNRHYHNFGWEPSTAYFGYGLQVLTDADIQMANVTANGNTLFGAHLEGGNISIFNGTFSNNGSDAGLDLFGKGLEIVSKLPGNSLPTDPIPSVSLFNITADNNKVFGANIQAVGDVAIDADLGKTNSFSGQLTYVFDPIANWSNLNGGYGLNIFTSQGIISLSRITTTGNFQYGASLNGANVAVSDSFFSTNGSGDIRHPAGSNMGFGLKVESSGVVTLNHIEANNNQLYGADIHAVGNVNVSAGIDQFNLFSSNMSVTIDPSNNVTFYGYGLTIKSETGDINLNNVEANYNHLWGASLDAMNIIINNGRFNNNISDSSVFIDDTGLIINSRGTLVALNNVEAMKNRLIGAVITDDLNTASLVDVYISNSTFTDNAGVTCSTASCPPGSQTYHGYGLNVNTKGLISLDTVDASNNNLYGADLTGSTVEVLNSTFNNNVFGNGLTINTTTSNTTGNVTLTNNTATGNSQNGADVSTPACAVVQVNGGTYTTNGQYDLSVTGGTLSQSGNPVIGNLFQNPATCIVVLNVTPASAPVSTTSSVATTSNTSTTLSAGTNTNTTVSNNKKTTKAKKAIVKKHKVKVPKVKVTKVRHARRFK